MGVSVVDSAENIEEYLAAIVENSDDAIITKNLDSVIQSWNKSAERMFGFTAEEAIGQPITMLLPDDRQHEEENIIARLRRGERIRHFETVRRCKNGHLLPISLTVSPVRNAAGEVIAASKIARDISKQREAAERQNMLLGEMRHRVGNSFAVAASLLTVTARKVETASELAALMQGHLQALSSVHKLTLSDPTGEINGSIPLAELLSSIIKAFADEKLVKFDIEHIRVASAAITPLTLIIYELSTNAIKYGALGLLDGHLSVTARQTEDRLIIDWREFCTIDPDMATREGFGSKLCQDVGKSALNGNITRQFETTGLKVRIDLDLATLAA